LPSFRYLNFSVLNKEGSRESEASKHVNSSTFESNISWIRGRSLGIWYRRLCQPPTNGMASWCDAFDSMQGCLALKQHRCPAARAFSRARAISGV